MCRQQHTSNDAYDLSSIDPAVYPCFNLYPAVDNGAKRTILKSSLGSATEKYSLNPVLETQYPTFSLCKYSFYSIHHSKIVIYLLQIRQPIPTSRYIPLSLMKLVMIQHKVFAFAFFPIGSPLVLVDKGQTNLGTAPPPSYPYFNLCTDISCCGTCNVLNILQLLLDPSIYPYIEIYPVAYFPGETVLGSSFPLNNDRPNKCVSKYPYFNFCGSFSLKSVFSALLILCLDPSLYPYFNLYPGPYGSRRMVDPSPGKKNDDKLLSPVLRTGYPSFRLCMYFWLLHIGLLKIHLSRHIHLSKL